MQNMLRIPLIHFFVLAAFSMLTSCALNNNWIQTKWLISGSPGQSSPEDALVRTTMLNRFDKFGYPHIRLAIQGDTLIVDTKLNRKDQQAVSNFHSLFTSNSLDLVPTFTRQDSLLYNLDTTLLQVPGFIPYFDIPDLSMIQEEVFGLACQETSLVSIQDSLQKRLGLTNGLQIHWSGRKKYNKAMGTFCYELYVLAWPETDWITERHIDRAFQYKDEYSTYYSVQLNFNAVGKQKFAQLTEKLAKKKDRAIAIVAYGRVLVAPRVMEPVYGGECIISGLFSFEEARTLARDINLGRLGFELTLLEEYAK